MPRDRTGWLDLRLGYGDRDAALMGVYEHSGSAPCVKSSQIAEVENWATPPGQRNKLHN